MSTPNTTPTEAELDEYGWRLSVAWYFRGDTTNRLAAVRAGLADWLEGAGDAALLEALREAYSDDEAFVYLHHMGLKYAACDDPVLNECAEILRAARAQLWDVGELE